MPARWQPFLIRPGEELEVTGKETIMEEDPGRFPICPLESGYRNNSSGTPESGILALELSSLGISDCPKVAIHLGMSSVAALVSGSGCNELGISESSPHSHR